MPGRIAFEIGEQGPAEPPAARLGGDGEGQEFGFIGDRAAEDEALRSGCEDAARQGEEAGEFVFAPRPRGGEAAQVQRGQRRRRHGRITGGGSAGGAASALRR